MSSFSRSGETLLLRTLAAHKNLEVVHQIYEPDIEEDLKLFSLLMKHKEESIALDNPALSHRHLDKDSKLILKNAVWEHKFKYRGFILVRNPYSVMRSAVVTGGESEKAYENHKKQCKRWGEQIDNQMVPYLLKADNLEAFCLLYVRKMVMSYNTGLPIVHYERFVTDPEGTLRKLFAALDLPWDQQVLHAHENYKEGQVGHGHIKLWRPIHTGSITKFRDIPQTVINRIYAYTNLALKLYGYKIEDKELIIEPDIDCRM
jgi:hypothetical protein